MKFKSIKIAAIITTALGITAVSIFNAPKSTHAESLQESLDNTNKLIDELREKQSGISSELSSLNSEIDKSSQKISSITADINEKQNEISDISAQIADLEKDQQEMYEAMKLRIQYSYENRRGSIYEAILSSEDFDDFLNRTMYVQNIVNYDKDQISKLANTIKEIADKKDTVTREMTALNQLKNEALAEAENLKNMVADKTSELSISDENLNKLLAQAEEYETKLEAEKQAREEAERQAYLESIKNQNNNSGNSSGNSGGSSGDNSSGNSGGNSGGSYTTSELDMMAAIIYVEAGIEPYEGKVAVGSVVMNRVASPYFPNTISGVIYQSGQFTPVASGRFELALTNNLANADCVRAAKEVLNGHRNVPYHFFHMYTGRPNNYSSYVIIGNHILYDY